ncbi:MAG: CRISPR-associated endoribonuclease Cas6, partial [Lachnoanaerobaculum sp.]|nr:CRISPR-associated endoribonuclease Cas6 [Lachnoanaerobaculum sp.]
KFDLSGLKKIIVPVYGIKIPVTIGNFIVSGDRRILNHILKTGLGSKRNSGFGLVEQVV